MTGRKKALALLMIVLVLALAACGGQENTGLLTEGEIGKLESLYLMEKDAALKGLGLTEADMESPEGSQGLWGLKEPRSIAEVDFSQVLMLSKVDTGLMGIVFSRRIESDEERRTLLREIYEQALSLYGEPDTYPGHEEDSRIAKQLERDLPGGCFETWELGEGTVLTLKLVVPSELGPLVDGIPGIGMEYRMKNERILN